MSERIGENPPRDPRAAVASGDVVLGRPQARQELANIVASYRQKGSFGPAMGSLYGPLYTSALGQLEPRRVRQVLEHELGRSAAQRAAAQLQRSVAQAVVLQVGARVREVLAGVDRQLGRLLGSSDARGRFVAGLGDRAARIAGLRALGLGQGVARRIAADPRAADAVFVAGLRSARDALGQIDYGAQMANLQQDVALDLMRDFRPVVDALYRELGIGPGSATATFVDAYLQQGARTKQRNRAYQLAATLAASLISGGVAAAGGALLVGGLSLGSTAVTGAPDVFVADATARQLRLGHGQRLSDDRALKRAERRATRARDRFVRDAVVSVVAPEAGAVLPLLDELGCSHSHPMAARRASEKTP